ncbi:MAG: hypothetical protein ACOX0L_06300 [Natronincolaceae bacterium]|jgi:hypothetical protein|nr:hypothetical protein [Bacillota bacterium]
MAEVLKFIIPGVWHGILIVTYNSAEGISIPEVEKIMDGIS